MNNPIIGKPCPKCGTIMEWREYAEYWLCVPCHTKGDTGTIEPIENIRMNLWILEAFRKVNAKSSDR